MESVPHLKTEEGLLFFPQSIVLEALWLFDIQNPGFGGSETLSKLLCLGMGFKVACFGNSSYGFDSLFSKLCLHIFSLSCKHIVQAA